MPDRDSKREKERALHEAWSFIAFIWLLLIHSCILLFLYNRDSNELRIVDLNIVNEGLEGHCVRSEGDDPFVAVARELGVNLGGITKQKKLVTEEEERPPRKLAGSEV